MRRAPAVRYDDEGVADIEIIWDGDYTTRGALEHISFSDDMRSLTFELWNTWTGRYGPGVYELRCMD